MSNESTSPHPVGRVVIIGAGLGGLTLARILQLKNIPATIYEHEPTAESRNQGGILDMHHESGQHALRLAGLYDEFEKVCSHEADHMRILDKTGAVCYEDEEHGPQDGDGPPHEGASMPQESAPSHTGGRPDEGGPPGEEGSPQDRPEVDRGLLRNLFLDSLKPETIIWGHTLRSVEPIAGDGHVGTKHVLKFANGESHVVDGLLVGADGTWSKVRPLLSDAIPSYSGVTYVELRLEDVDKLHPATGELIGKGTMLALGHGKGLVAQRNSGDRARVYLQLKVPQDWHEHCGIPVPGRPDETRRSLCQLFPGWAPKLLDLINLAVDEPSCVHRPLYALPVGHSWKTCPGVTLLGDAAHVMVPSGEGANLAMLDAVELAEAIASVSSSDPPDALAKAIEQFEKRMFARSEQAAAEAVTITDIFLSEGAPKAAVELFERLMSGGAR